MANYFLRLSKRKHWPIFRNQGMYNRFKVFWVWPDISANLSQGFLMWLNRWAISSEITLPLNLMISRVRRSTYWNMQEILILKNYDEDAYTEVHTDASSHRYGAVLFQPVQYMNRRTSTAESKYWSYDLKVLAVVIALRTFREDTSKLLPITKHSRRQLARKI